MALASRRQGQPSAPDEPTRGPQQPASEVDFREDTPIVSPRQPKALRPSCAEEDGPEIEILSFGLSASRTGGCAQKGKHECHSKQEAKVVLVPVIVHFVHLHALLDE